MSGGLNLVPKAEVVDELLYDGRLSDRFVMTIIEWSTETWVVCKFEFVTWVNLFVVTTVVARVTGVIMQWDYDY